MRVFLVVLFLVLAGPVGFFFWVCLRWTYRLIRDAKRSQCPFCDCSTFGGFRGWYEHSQACGRRGA